MKLIKNFNPPEFTRITFHSNEARDYWAPLIQKARSAVIESEFKSVADGIRDCATTQIPNIGGDYLYKKLSHYGLKWNKIYKVGAGNGFSHKAHPPAEGDNFYWYSVVSKDEDKLEEFELANNNSNHVLIGDLLGFPSCCCDWFSKVWPKYRDPVWQVVQNTEGSEERDWYFQTQLPVNVLRVNGHPACNPCLRYLGIRLMFHIPCSFRCEGTIQRAEDWYDILDDIDEEAAQATKYLLSLPLSWDCNSGWAKIITPPFTLHAGSIECAYRHVVEVDPDPYLLPEGDIPGAVGGSVFPMFRGG